MERRALRASWLSQRPSPGNLWAESGPGWRWGGSGWGVPSRKSVKGRAARLAGSEAGGVQHRPSSPLQHLLSCLETREATAKRGRELQGDGLKAAETGSLWQALGVHEDRGGTASRERA